MWETDKSHCKKRIQAEQAKKNTILILMQKRGHTANRPQKKPFRTQAGLATVFDIATTY